MQELMVSLGWHLGLQQEEGETREDYFLRIREYVQEHPDQYQYVVDKVVKRKPCVVRRPTEKEKDNNKMNAMKTLMSVANGLLR